MSDDVITHASIYISSPEIAIIHKLMRIMGERNRYIFTIHLSEVALTDQNIYTQTPEPRSSSSFSPLITRVI